MWFWKKVTAIQCILQFIFQKIYMHHVMVTYSQKHANADANLYEFIIEEWECCVILAQLTRFHPCKTKIDILLRQSFNIKKLWKHLIWNIKECIETYKGKRKVTIEYKKVKSRKRVKSQVISCGSTGDWWSGNVSRQGNGLHLSQTIHISINVIIYQFMHLFIYLFYISFICYFMSMTSIHSWEQKNWHYN